MTITLVTVADGCTGCGLCEQIAPDVFEVKEVAVVKSGIDLVDNEDQIKEAADSCPVAVIKVS
jgi:ferredoxin